MSSQLENLVESGTLHRASPDRTEYQGFVSSGRARLKDAENEAIARDVAAAARALVRGVHVAAPGGDVERAIAVLA